ncbi:MAG: type IV-A pilus assembly ATPase PilB [Betaproteobacteria bacterium]|nr:MAG: type IV-A pilus assembly ATPase PilB [Betaproteobacteria bacterium]
MLNLATPSASVLLSGLGRALVQQDILRQIDAEQTQNQANASSMTFVEQLIASKKVTSAKLAEFASQTFGVPLFDLNAFDLTSINAEWIDVKLITARRALPLHKRGNRLYVAVSDPTNLQALEEFRFKTNLIAEPVVVEDDKLAKAISSVSDRNDRTLSNLVGNDDLDLDMTSGEIAPAEDDGGGEVDDAPVVRYIQKILLDAINSSVSDIHFEPYEKYFRIRYRLDGVLVEVAQPPLVIKDKVASRIKVISKLDISEKRIPQDGRMKLQLTKNRSIDFRVSTLPTLYGEKIVMRILDSSNAMVGIDALGYEPDQKALLLDAISRPYGMILVTGPTGSGKTISLYTCLGLLNKPGINISTAEDPAEITMPGVNQVNVNDKAGLNFAAALKSFLRQDPDIIMVGEIRDLETADISIKAAQTGHLVLSTLHTNDAPKTLMRLLNMGVAPFNIASSVLLITAQRLARRLCVQCKQPADIPVEALLRSGYSESDIDGTWTPYRPVGCDTCKGTGYKGRVGLYEVMPISEEMQRIIMSAGNSMEIAAQAQREGIRNLRQSGLIKVKQGVTSLEEVEATTNA